MNTELRNLKKEYLRKILNISLCNKNYSSIIFYATFCLDDIKDIIEELKEEFNIVNVIFIDHNYKKIKDFYSTHPVEIEIEKFIPRFPIPARNTKIIYFNNNATDLSNDYYSEYSCKYREHLLNKYNYAVYEKITNAPREDVIIVACPNKDWAKTLLGPKNEINNLWDEISKTVLPKEKEKEEALEKINRTKRLNEMKIHNLHFYTDLGTDFKISLNPHSLWSCIPFEDENRFYYFNYPSYEIFTSPNCYSAEGKIVLSKQRDFFNNIKIKNASFEFSKGKLINCNSNSDYFNSVLLNASNNLNRIGEIALVSQDSPLSHEEFYNSVLLDENTGCHFALGHSVIEGIGIDPKKIKENGYRYYKYNNSKHHIDFVFGNDSIVVEAETKNKEKILLMDKGIWKI